MMGEGLHTLTLHTPSHSHNHTNLTFHTLCYVPHTHTHTHTLPTAVLVLFLNTQLNFTEDSSTAIYHAFIMLCYILPLLGAVISDSCLGKYL